ncbi:DNA-directed RNA polymerase I subunit RPA12 isoform X2 [Protopterus annectens]|nr:DNA-directed RNA polymerase I subunit RPA12 isoform X2 [Protopterus annectens]XP_043928034.1 DNA-directed RNA polymerase I subunit RPA12 isoform X2 [Protopterus annectens]XP_043928035.1 DNA-directed RNA polymerase I subunit RPA12 isoform X2 [Protopterus annectens]XP_043928036.1 DNA-directed RNA polymerase I subunit RPA12 isoform X2 [Protopterus annectens]XP_043928037.1 DNA-directed RNA polymerase I subunit RPA12 isoform X2 [Protopterus annectens]XP_043928038.1 DNA-directed RNA polymerase I 
MAKERSFFQSETDFCPECGTILPLPGLKDTVVCRRCNFSIDVHEFEGRPIFSAVIFNKPGTFSVQEEEGELKGPVIDRKCSRCGHEGMVYHTRQMRSADEGQTVFYTCTNCRYQEKEDS